MESLSFDTLERREIPVTIDGIDYVLRECTAADAAKFQNAATGAARFDDGKIVRTEGLGDLDALIVSLCLHNGSGNRVHIDVVKTWPARVVSLLSRKAREISGLIDAPEEPDKGN